MAILLLPPFVPVCPSGMDDISDDSQDSHILILTFLIISRIASAWSILYG
jgi:hypothetical protein